MSTQVPNYTKEELDAMSESELARLGTELDGVHVKFRKQRFPVPGTKAEKRAERTVAFWFILAAIAALGFLATYLFWPYEYKSHLEEGYWWHTFNTPLLGLTFGVAVLALGVGLVQFTKRFVPEEISVQERHDGPSDPIDQATTVALLNDAWKTSTLGRRKLLMGTLIGGGALTGLAALFTLGGLIKNPWRRGEMTVAGDGTVHTSGWTLTNTQKVYLGRDTGAIGVEHDGHYTVEGVRRLVPMRAEDLAAGGMETVFPLPASALDNYETHMHAIHGIRNPVMLIRLRPEDAAKAIQREKQENFHYGDYYAYSKICTHVGCPTSLYEQQTNRILCPCHQSQFDALHYGKPVFGPAGRALPQLPITVDQNGFLVANGDFIEAVGPAFWERKS